MKNATGQTVQSPNLTFDATGIADWTEADLQRALREGVSKNNRIIAFPMPLYAELNDEEISSVYAYLKSIPPVENKVRRHPENNVKGTSGEELYRKYDCQSCHGKSGNAPFSLIQASGKYDADKLKQYIRNPRLFGNTRMPAFESRIAENEYPELIQYVIKLGHQSEANK